MTEEQIRNMTGGDPILAELARKIDARQSQKDEPRISK